MPIDNKGFSGVMNLDDDNDVLPKSHHKEAYNVVFRGNGVNQIAQSIPGTRLITNTNLQTGTNVCLGSHYDQLKNRVFYFVYNSNGKDGIYVYDVGTNTITPLLISMINSAVALFNFNVNYPIASVNILYRPENEGDILFWTDGINRPKKLNILEALSSPKKYGNLWLPQYLTVSQNVPASSPVCKYIDDSSINLNNLKNKLFQFAYRYIYFDNTKSVISPYSRLFTPVNADNIATEKDPLKNNLIQIQYNSGDKNVKSIELLGRSSLDTTFGDVFSIITLEKSKLNILDNTTQTYNFYNQDAYQFIDQTETTLLYSLVPIKANAQELLNGNQLIYGGITEGLNFDTELNVSTSVSLIQNTTNAAFTFFLDDNYTLTYDQNINEYRYTSGDYYLIFQGVPNVGESYVITFELRRYVNGNVETVSIPITLGVLTNGQNNFATMESLLDAAITANSTFNIYGLTNVTEVLTGVDPLFPGKYGVKIGGNTFWDSWVTDISNIQYNYVVSPLPVDPTGTNIACYKHNSRYGFGLVYFTEYGETDGVHTTSAMSVITPQITSTALGSSQLLIPAIQFNINHAPPSWAKYYSFVRTENLTVSNLFTIFTTNAYKDTDYGYLDITAFQTNTNGYNKYSYVKGDRLRLVGLYNGTANVNDYPILDVINSLTIGANPAMTGSFIKLKYDSVTMGSFAANQKWYLEVYTPPKNTVDSGTQVYYEFGESYPIGIDVNGNRVHLAPGQTQNQVIGTGVQPAIFKFFRGEVYIRLRGIDWVIDKSMSDFFPSQISGNGRSFVIDVTAKQTYNPTLVRYSMPYSQSTLQNDTNMFYAQNFDEYDISRGDIRRLKVRGGQMRVFQSRSVGVVGVLENMIYNADGSDNLIQTNKIINQIHYYQGHYGMGWMNTSLASSSNADYFVDPIRGYQLRVSGDGITPISEIYKGQYYISKLSPKYVKPVNGTLGGYAKVLGVYDFFEEEYVSVFQGFTGQSNITLAFNELKNCYSTFYSFAPESINSIESRLISFKGGNIYVHDDVANYNKFYGVQYSSSITLVFNDMPMVKKDYNAITQDCSSQWISNTIGDIFTSIGQRSNLVAIDYENTEGLYNAAFMRDADSLYGIIEGDFLKGTWLLVKLNSTSSNLVYLSGVFVNYTLSEKNM